MFLWHCWPVSKWSPIIQSLLIYRLWAYLLWQNGRVREFLFHPIIFSNSTFKWKLVQLIWALNCLKPKTFRINKSNGRKPTKHVPSSFDKSLYDLNVKGLKLIANSTTAKQHRWVLERCVVCRQKVWDELKAADTISKAQIEPNKSNWDYMLLFIGPTQRMVRKFLC